MTVFPAELGRLPLDSLVRSPHSPDVPAGVEAIALRGAERVVPRGEPVFPIAGAYQVSGPRFNRFPCLPDEIVIVAVREGSPHPLATNLARPAFVSPPGHLDPLAPGFETMLVGGWFNLNLYTWLPQLGVAPGRVHVYATLGELVSNTVTVEIAAR